MVFKCNDEKLAIDISYIDKIIEFTEPKKIPESSRDLLGVIQHNEEIIPIIDLNLRLYQVETVKTLDTKVIVILFREKYIGLVVDNVLEIKLFEDEICEDADFNVEVMQEYIDGFIKDLEKEDITIILNVDKLFTENQALELLEISSSE